MPQVLKIMAKRGGEFPRKISDQRYNEFIKKVCEIAGFNEPTEGGIMIEGRKIKSVYPFYKLVTSHSGRKTYVTLYSQYIPTEILQIQTNHHSKEMVEHYNKTDEDLLNNNNLLYNESFFEKYITKLVMQEFVKKVDLSFYFLLRHFYNHLE